MSRPVLLNAFFTQFNAFLGELKQMYPDDVDFPTYLTTINLLKGTNPMLVVRYIKEHVIDVYGEKIKNHDESFFLSHGYESHAEEVDLNIVEKLKGYVQTMSPETKNAIWKYLDILTALCVKILEIA
jgi:hypothetical protein